MVVGGVLKVRLGSLRPKTRNWGTGSELSAPPEPWRPRVWLLRDMWEGACWGLRQFLQDGDPQGQGGLTQGLEAQAAQDICPPRPPASGRSTLAEGGRTRAPCLLEPREAAAL